MNNKGQLSIIAALLVAVVLVGTIMVTFSKIRDSSIQESPQILSAIDEIDLAIDQILSSTIRYYGSVLKVTGNSSYAKSSAQSFLYKEIQNIPSMYPGWGISLSVGDVRLRVSWFSNYSYSSGTLSINYDLKGLGLSNINYNSSSSLMVQTNNETTASRAKLTVTRDLGSPVANLGRQNFGFYSYNYTNSTWNVISPNTLSTTFTNGTYVIDLPQGVDSDFYVVQVEDQRGLMVLSSSSSFLASGLNWNASQPPSAHYVDNNVSNIDFVGGIGSHSNFTAQQNGPDTSCDTLTEEPVTSTQSNAYYPSDFTLQGLTQNVTGSLTDLQTDNSNYMSFSSWASATSAASLYSQQTTTSVGNSSYYTLGLANASQAGLTLNAGMSSVGRTLFGKLVYPLTGVNTINASTWTVNYRAWKTDPATMIINGTSTSNTQSSLQNYISWTHTVASGSNRLLVVTISTFLDSGTPATCTGCTYNGTVMNPQVNNSYTISTQVRSYIFTLTSPPAGSAYTIRANFSVNTLSVGGAVSYLNVNQTSPVQATNSTTGRGTSASVSVSVSGSGRAVYSSLAGYRTSSWTLSDSSDQTHRWAQSGQLYKGDGDDRLNVSPGSVTTSWAMTERASYVALAIVINPFTVTPSAGHCDVDILIRKSDGTIRTNVTTSSAASGPLTGSASTLSGTYAWSNYSVVAQTDYLEFDFYANTTTALAGATAYLMIDNSTLELAQQTHIDNACLPSQYASAVVFEGISDSQAWTQLNWTINSKCTTAEVNVTCRLYNFNTGLYPANGDGYQTTTVGTMDVTQSQTISTNPTYYRNGTNWFRIIVQCVKTTTAQFYWNCDLVQFLKNYTTTNYRLDLEEQWTNVDYNNTDQLAIYLVGSPTENLEVDFWNGNTWNPINSSLASGWNNATVSSYMTSSNFTIRFLDGNQVGDTVQNSWQIDAALVRTNTNLYGQLQNATIAVELLQNGTMLWLGQEMTTTKVRPIPPIPVKSFHVNQTINGIDREVPYQIEDWASSYRIPLGLSSNSSVFSSRSMLVYLVTPRVSRLTVWWNGSDDAVQTPLAYTNQYFTVDTVQRTATNEILNLKIDLPSNAFHVTSTVGSSVCTSELFRINNVVSSYGNAEPNYAITNGPVRVIIHHEVEWSSNGIPNCYDTLAHLVITLPANATYYTYALRLMFLNTTTTRTITDLCPIKLNSTINTIQTENGTAAGYPTATSTTGLFFNQSQTTWAHHWSQFISGTKGAGIMFADVENQRLYVFDSPSTKTGALMTNSSANKIELLPVTMSQISLPNAFDVTWHGAIVTFDGTTPIYKEDKTGLWIIVEYPPSLT
jgi:hypothetical protein